MRRIIYALMGVALLASPAAAQNSSFTNFITNAPEATTPFGASDLVPVIQGGATKHYPALSIIPGMLPDASNADLPTALQNLGLQVPASCDGYSATDGAITSSAANFTSASANFTSADVGKRIAIAGAGAAQHLNTVTIVGGGAGHTVGEVIPLTGGTGSAGSVIVRAVSAGVITELGAENLGTYTAVPSNPVTVGDATITATWLRDALVTTIQARNSATSVTLGAFASATVSGARWGYGSDYSAQINAALVASKNVQLPSGLCGVASSVLLNDTNVLAGKSMNQTKLMWLGASRGGPIVVTANTGSTIYFGGRLENLWIEGLGSADTCLDLHGINAWRLQNIYSGWCVTTATALDPTVQGSVIENHFTSMIFDSGAVTTVSSMPLRFGNRNPSSDPGGASNIGYNRFYDLRIFFYNQTGLQCGYADNNHFFGVWMWQYPTSTALRAIDFQADTDPAACQNMTFYGLTLAPENAAGNIVSRGGSSTSSNSIILYGLNIAAGIPNATVETGASLFCKPEGGNDNLCTPRAFGHVFSAAPTGVTDTAAFRMFGLGATFTPNYSGRMTFTISGSLKNNTAGSGGLVVAQYGTGTPPTNGAAITGTTCGSFPGLTNTPSTTFTTPFSTTCHVTGFISGTTYWVDLAGKALVSGTLSPLNVDVTYDEAP